MLTLHYQEDNTALERAIFGSTLDCGSTVVLMNDDIPCGVARFRLTDTAIILDRVGILQGMRGQQIGEFYIRSLLFKFSFYNMDIIISYKHDYYTKLGFKDNGNGTMIAKGGQVKFPSSCGGCK